MPVIKSAIKKAKQDVRAREHNRGIRDAYKVAVKAVRKAAEAGETKKAKDLLPKAFSEIDKAAKRNVLHKNNAARRKSRLAALFSEKPRLKDDQPLAETKKKAETKKEK